MGCAHSLDETGDMTTMDIYSVSTEGSVVFRQRFQVPLKLPFNLKTRTLDGNSIEGFAEIFPDAIQTRFGMNQSEDAWVKLFMVDQNLVHATFFNPIESTFERYKLACRAAQHVRKHFKNEARFRIPLLSEELHSNICDDELRDCDVCYEENKRVHSSACCKYKVCITCRQKCFQRGNFKCPFCQR